MSQEKNEIDKKIYCIMFNNGKTPMVLGENIVLLYDEKNEAELAAADLSKKCRIQLGTDYLKAVLIENKVEFFSRCVAHGLNTYLLNGKGKLCGHTTFCKEELTSVKKDGGFQNEQKLLKNLQQNIIVQPANGKKHRKASWKMFFAVVICFYLIRCAVGHLEKKNVTDDEDTKEYGAVYSDNNDLYNYKTPDYSLAYTPFDWKIIGKYSTDLEYKRGTIQGDEYISDFAKLRATINPDYSWMTNEELSTIISNEEYKIDWEFGIKGKESDCRFDAMFTLCIEDDSNVESILEEVNPGYAFDAWYGPFYEKSTSFNESRMYNLIKLIEPSGLTREYYVNKVNDRLICIFSQYDSLSAGEELINYIKYMN